jgi:hypothetical protein
MPVGIVRIARTAALAAVVMAAACGDSFSPTLETVAGTYTATTFTTTANGTTTDQLAAGGSLVLTLAAGGTTSGQLVVPAVGDAGADFIADMAGTWVLTGDKVTFTQGADTFVRDMTFTATENELRGDETFGGTRVQVTLRRGGV